jgi:hypothetical protein
MEEQFIFASGDEAAKDEGKRQIIQGSQHFCHRIGMGS